MRFFLIFIFLSILFLLNKAEIISLLQSKFNLLNIKISEFSKIQSVKIKNTKYIDEALIHNKVDLNKNNLISLNLESLKSKILEIDEIKSIMIKKEIHGELDIYIEEKEPFVFWIRDNKKFVIDEEGNILRYKNYKNEELKTVEGKLANLNAKDFIGELSLFPHLYSKLKSAEYINQYRWNIRLIDDTEIKLPYQDKESKSLKMLEHILNEKNYMNFDGKVIDMRITGRIFIR